MTDLSPRARAACEALRANGASKDERERVRARLSTLGVAMSVGAGAAFTAGTAASAAASVASFGAQASAPGALPATVIATQAGGSTLVAGGAFAAKSALLGAAGVSKLIALPVVVKTGLAVVAVSSALVAPTLFTRTPPLAKPVPVERAQPQVAHRPLAQPSTLQRTVTASAPPRAQVAITTPPPAAPHSVNRGAARRQIVAPTRTAAAARALTRESTLAAESALLAQALSALRSGHAERARDLLQRHEEIYGAHALLARERERMRRELSHLLR